MRRSGSRLWCIALAAAGAVAALACALPPAALAEGDAAAAGAAAPKHPRPGSRGGQNLDFLFGALKAAPDAASAKIVENRILALWLASGSDTADLLMTRVKAAVDAKDIDLALRLLDAVVEIKPDYVEAWNRRATLHFMQKDFGSAMLDLRQVLAREPRHFGALVGLGLVMQELGEDKRALEAFRRALEIHPYLPRVPDLIKDLSAKIEGRAI
ncbi:MAG: tetratricopeptide repeat protein [Variibacter sp.]|nr:tetratricopeptide repeat protein [Variibacter sp.]